MEISPLSKARCRFGQRAMPLPTESSWDSENGMIWQVEILFQ